jgi:chromate reductase
MTSAPPRDPVKFLVFSASLRAASLNTRLARLVARLIEEHGGTVDTSTMAAFDGPSLNEEINAASGLPSGPAELCRRLEASDAFVIAAPEYNASMSGVLKNAIDWASRQRPQPFNGRHALLLSASPSILRGRLERTIVAFMDLVEAAKHYPCAKKAWVEFLGEHPNPLIDRVE